MSASIPGHEPILFDLGTGLRYYGQSFGTDRLFRGTCLLSHLHWDHIQGLPFFSPLLREGAQLDIYAPTQESGTAAEIFAESFCPPLFPIPLVELPATITFHEILDADFSIGEAEVMAREVPHAGTTVGYRLTWQGRSVVYMSDHQMPADGSFAATDGALELCRDADLVIHDAQYTPTEFAERATWGHCTVEYAVWLAAESGAKRLALFHHDPAHHDEMLDVLGAQAVECGAGLGVDVFAAREGLTVSVGP